MTPEAHQSSGFTPRRVRKQRKRGALVAAVVGVVIAVAIVGLTFVLATNSDDPNVNLGDDVFVVGRAEPLLAPIERDGPLLFQDLVDRDRDLFVQHLGDDPDTGWLAFEATAPDRERRCQLRWNRTGRHFVDPCDGTQWPADGEGLVHYAATVGEDGRLRVDLRAPRDQAGD